MRRKPTIRKTGDHWVVTVPGYGFAGDTARTAADYDAARRTLGEMLSGRPSASSGAVLSSSHWHEDGIAAAPHWEPLRRTLHPFRYRC